MMGGNLYRVKPEVRPLWCKLWCVFEGRRKRGLTSVKPKDSGFFVMEEIRISKKNQIGKSDFYCSPVITTHPSYSKSINDVPNISWNGSVGVENGSYFEYIFFVRCVMSHHGRLSRWCLHPKPTSRFRNEPAGRQELILRIPLFLQRGRCGCSDIKQRRAVDLYFCSNQNSEQALSQRAIGVRGYYKRIRWAQRSETGKNGVTMADVNGDGFLIFMYVG